MLQRTRIRVRGRVGADIEREGLRVEVEFPSSIRELPIVEQRAEVERAFVRASERAQETLMEDRARVG